MCGWKYHMGRLHYRGAVRFLQTRHLALHMLSTTCVHSVSYFALKQTGTLKLPRLLPPQVRSEVNEVQDNSVHTQQPCGHSTTL